MTAGVDTKRNDVFEDTDVEVLEGDNFKKNCYLERPTYGVVDKAYTEVW